MASILQLLRQWSEALPFWQQAALDQIVSGRPFTDEDLDLLVQYILEDKKLQENISERPVLKHLAIETEKAASPDKKVRLVSVSDLSNVNALAENQKLTFNEQFTVIYGDNGSGKSGYARLLGCAGFTRGDNEVFPNVMDPATAGKPQTAKLEISVDGNLRVVDYTVGHACPDAASIYVFDSRSVEIHLTKYNKISFAPAGLSYLTDLAKVFDACTKKLTDEIAPEVEPHDFLGLFGGESEVKDLIKGIGFRPDLASIKRVAKVSADDEKRLHELDGEIAELKTRDVTAQIGDVAQTIQDLKALRDRLASIAPALAPDAIAKLSDQITTVSDLQRLAEKSGASEFESADFSQTGTPVWMRFVGGAKELAELERSVDGHSVDSKCLLCRQDLSEEAQALLQKLWDFLDNASKSNDLTVAKAALSQHRGRLAGLDLTCFGEQSIQRRYLEENRPEITETVKKYLADVDITRTSIIDKIDKLEKLDDSATSPASGVDLIDETVSELEQKILDLRNIDPGEKIRTLSAEQTLLAHRVVVRDNLDAITKYMEKVQWTEKARKAAGTTTHITRKYNELFKDLVTERYIKLFEEFLRQLNCPLMVKLETKAQKGETMRQITLIAKEAKIHHKIEKVLSDGEKRAVALADFLTEISLGGPKHGIILDDPVTSLDWGWKETVAKLLVAQASERQVIVFTHDITFLYLIKQCAQESGAEISCHRIWKKEENRPGLVHLDGAPTSYEEYRTSDAALSAWKDALAADNPTLLHQHLVRGFDCLRSSYEALVVHELFRKVVLRFDSRISIGRLTEVVFDLDVVDQIVEKYAYLSGFIGGHLGTDNVGDRSTPQLLKREIDNYEALKSTMKKLRKEKGKAGGTKSPSSDKPSPVAT